MVHGFWVALVGGIALSAFACSASEDGSAEERQFGTGGSGNGGASGSTSGGAGGVATGGSGALGTGGTLIATGGSAGAGSSGCSKLDFLFVVDNSVSMEDQQAALVA